ncbi:uncharacterized protein LOC113373119 [Ctenocephalides felis]|uniref:uncharacterized protein LOC113371402 n=1 Tax=Ctenocephalides felis TaxID=7515 RepID=UPI000E6E41B1|nr:uncharacterized protein LOC113371402 [Ctenocephalides felis]XP_026469253.1 uncharacterized protein LOC113373119 [Ctenocephalides felis]
MKGRVLKYDTINSPKEYNITGGVPRLMPNIGGPKQSRRLTLASVVASVLTYGIPIWADALGLQESWRKIGPVYRLSALRVVCGFRTISEEAVCVNAGTLPLRVLAEARQNLYQRKRSTTLSADDLRTEERLNTIRRWQIQ